MIILQERSLLVLHHVQLIRGLLLLPDGLPHSLEDPVESHVRHQFGGCMLDSPNAGESVLARGEGQNR